MTLIQQIVFGQKADVSAEHAPVQIADTNLFLYLHPIEQLNGSGILLQALPRAPNLPEGVVALHSGRKGVDELLKRMPNLQQILLKSLDERVTIAFSEGLTSEGKDALVAIAIVYLGKRPIPTVASVLNMVA